MCHRPSRSAAAKKRGGIGGRCWRKLRPDQRRALRQNPNAVRAILTRPVPTSDGQLSLEEHS